jgi:hypothetical protein
MRCKAAWKEIIYKCVQNQVEVEDLGEAIMTLGLQDFAPHIICMACRHHKVDPDDLERDGPQNLAQEMVEEALSQQKEAQDAKDEKERKESSNPKSNTSEESGVGKSAGEDPAGGTGKSLPGEDSDEQWNRFCGM